VLHPKKVGALPIEGSDAVKQTNEIGIFIPLVDAITIEGKDITADAFDRAQQADYLVGRGAHYHFIVKGNQSTLQADIALFFERQGVPDYTEVTHPNHGRIETRRIWCSTELNSYLDFPHVGQVYMIEREVFHKKSQKRTVGTALGITSRTTEQADAQRFNVQSWALGDRKFMPLYYRLELRRRPQPYF